MDVAALDRLVVRYFQAGLAPSTQRSYDSAKRRFLTFCQKICVSNPLPVNEQLLCRYVACLAAEGLSSKTINLYLSAIRHLQIAAHFPDPNIHVMPRLEQVIKGSKRVAAKQGQTTRPRLPITPDILLKLRRVWGSDPHNFDSVMMWAASCLCYFGFLRAGEITVPSEAAYDKDAHLNFADIAVDNVGNPQMLKVTIKASKTDPFRQGVDIFVGRTSNELCPVAAVLAYLVRRGNDQGLLFRFEDGRLLTRDRFVTQIRRALSAAGIDCKRYAGHSFRIGAATAAGRRGLPPATIKTLGRWSSSAYLLYIRLPRQQLAEVSKLIG